MADELNNNQAEQPLVNEPAALVADEKTGKADAKKIKARKKKAKKNVTVGRAYVQATYNNTIVTLTDASGNVLSWSSAGLNGFKGPKKATPFAASIITRDAVEKAKACGLKDVSVFVKGVGMGREGAVRALNANGLNILSIKDITPIPHNGCRRPRPRKV
ncbi:MAG: 30S ribosomal protein S11 [Parcubacteria group bacterium]